MKSIGLDIGTTTISAVIVDQSQTIQDVVTTENNTFLPGASYEKIQDARKIEQLAMDLFQTCLERCQCVASVGITGQMHGIVYLDQEGNLLSPLYTWQDGRGNLPYNDELTWSEHLSSLSSYPLATGYGIVTHCYNLAHNLVPPNTSVLCTIQDYIAMKLARQTVPKIDPTNAASLGCYNANLHCFDEEALKRIGVDPKILPEVANDPLLGITADGMQVFCAIGDNQASFLGATDNTDDVLLLNVGTGGQISMHSNEKIETQTLEARPYMDGGCLLVGSLLCAGRSFALLEQFFRDTVQMVTGVDTPVYPAVNRTLAEVTSCTDYPRFSTTFQGTRQDPTLRGSITELSVDNFTPVHFMYGMMYGIAEEMHAMYRDYLQAGGKQAATIVGSGNGLRKNPNLCQIISEVFQCQLLLSQHQEEAAYGAAMYALLGGNCGTHSDESCA